MSKLVDWLTKLPLTVIALAKAIAKMMRLNGRFKTIDARFCMSDPISS
jgi:hypothetical protein